MFGRLKYKREHDYVCIVSHFPVVLLLLCLRRTAPASLSILVSTIAFVWLRKWSRFAWHVHDRRMPAPTTFEFSLCGSWMARNFCASK